MSLSLVHQPSVSASASPYRLLDAPGQEIAWANAFLDAQRIRQLSLRSLRAYAYDLLHFARWSLQQPVQPLAEITESTLLNYVRYQLDQQPKPAPPTVNHRLVYGALLVSLPLWPRGSGRPVSFPAHLHEAISARLWPTSPRHRLRPAAQGTTPRGHPALGRRGRTVLAKLSHVSRPRPGGLDVARWIAFL